MKILRGVLKCLAIGVLLSSPVLVFAQFDAQVTQFMFNVQGYNPAAIGEQQMMKIFGMQRLQWVGIKNAPSTTDFLVEAPFQIKNTHHAVGIHFQNDAFGLFVNQRVGFMYAYKQKIGEGFLSIGTSLGFTNMTIKGDSAYIPSGGSYHNQNDLEIPKSKQSDIGFDMDLGIYYSHPDFDVSFSILHLTKPTIEWGENSEFYLSRTYLVSGGYKFKLPNPNYTIKPSLLVKTDFISWQMDVNLTMEYKTKFWWGLSYRIQDAVSVLAGLRVLNGLRIGYSYDLPTSKIIKASSGSHELFLSYEFKLNIEKKNSKYKSVRFL